METKVLVAYATSYGSTQEIAEVISETLRSQGLAVDLQPIRKVRAKFDLELAKFPWLTPVSVEIVGGKHIEPEEFLIMTSKLKKDFRRRGSFE